MLGELISAGANLLGGLIGSQSTSAANAANIKHQKEFAQQGVRWRVEDAKAAGVHPLYALGAQTHSFSPSVVGDSSMGAAMSNMGQDISRAVTAGSTAEERLYNSQVKSLTLQRMELENSLLGAQIANTSRQAGTGPAFPGQVTPDGEVKIASPFGLPDLVVAHPDLAQQAQDHFGDPLEWPYGLANWIESVGRGVEKWSTQSGQHWRKEVWPRVGDELSRLWHGPW